MRVCTAKELLPNVETCACGCVCRRADKQPADLPNEEGEEEDVQELAMDDVLMLDQEPEPEYDLDDVQRPRLSRVSAHTLGHPASAHTLRQHACSNTMSVHTL